MNDAKAIADDLRLLDITTLAPQPTKRVILLVRRNGPDAEPEPKSFDMFSLLDLPIPDYVQIEDADLKNLEPAAAMKVAVDKLKKLIVGTTDADFELVTMRQFFALLAFAAKDIDPRNNANPQPATTDSASPSN